MNIKPWVFKIETTKGCNLRCDFCPVYAHPEYQGSYFYLQTDLCDTLTRQAAELNPTIRIELSMRGEPIMNPYLVENVRLMRQNIPLSQISLFTNGVRLLKEPELAADLIRAGVNILNVECYKNTRERFLTALGGVIDHYGFTLEDFERFSAYRKYPKGHTLRVVNLVPDIALPERVVRTRWVHNMAGNVDAQVYAEKYQAGFTILPMKKRCARPFRELTVTYDGHMLVCCHDWGMKGIIGRVPPDNLRDLWYGPEYRAYLTKLYNKDRRMPPCNTCDYHGGYRLGLLPNPQT